MCSIVCNAVYSAANTLRLVWPTLTVAALLPASEHTSVQTAVTHLFGRFVIFQFILTKPTRSRSLFTWKCCRTELVSRTVICLLLICCFTTSIHGGGGRHSLTGAAGMGRYPVRQADLWTSYCSSTFIKWPNENQTAQSSCWPETLFQMSGSWKCKMLLPYWVLGPIPAASVISSNDIWPVHFVPPCDSWDRQFYL